MRRWLSCVAKFFPGRKLIRHAKNGHRSQLWPYDCGHGRYGDYVVSLCLVVVSLLLSGAATQKETNETQILPPGYTELSYAPPVPGSYTLPPLGTAIDGEVLTEEGVSTTLYGVYENRIVLLSFIYTTCSDLSGCPLATAVLHKLKRRLQAEPALTERLRLVTLSFDPGHDTPEVMRQYGSGFQGKGVQWRFLTTRSQEALAPILAGYGQSIQQDYDEQGQPRGTFSHILRVFLIDRRRRIRNIYSVSFLHADVLINDVKTLMLQERLHTGPAQQGVSSEVSHVHRHSRAGDYKAGYERSGYRTRSLALPKRRGDEADLMGIAAAPPLGLPSLPVPQDNPLTKEKVTLGRKLFYDRRLSLNDTFSCAMCHIPEQGFTNNEMSTAVGIEGRTVRRNAPTIYNAAYLRRLFHDGREYTLEQQVWAPLLAKNEMANPSIGAVIEKLRHMPDYEGLFEQAYHGRGPSMETVGMAIASYERTLLSANSAFDRWYFDGREGALEAAAKRGFGLFTGKAGCHACHTIAENHALFTDNGMHNTGVGYRESMLREPPVQRIVVAPGVTLDVASDVIATVSESRQNDLGRYEITQDPRDRWKYRTPTLRNVALTSPYMHDGSLSTLSEVVAFYNLGGVPNEVIDPLIRPLHLSEQEGRDLVAFLESLTGDNVELLVADAFAAPVGDLTRADPNWAHGR